MPQVTFSFPVFAIARYATPDKFGGVSFHGFHIRVAKLRRNATANCLMLFTSPEKVYDYTDSRAHLANLHIVEFPTKLDLEYTLADLRQLGVTLVAFDGSRHTVMTMDNLVRQLEQME